MLTYHTHFTGKTTEAQRDSVIELVKWQSQAMNPESNFRACGYLIYTAARIGVCVWGGGGGRGREGCSFRSGNYSFSLPSGLEQARAWGLGPELNGSATSGPPWGQLPAKPQSPLMCKGHGTVPRSRGAGRVKFNVTVLVPVCSEHQPVLPGPQLDLFTMTTPRTRPARFCRCPSICGVKWLQKK